MQRVNRKTAGLFLVILGVFFFLSVWHSERAYAATAGIQQVKTIAWRAKITKKAKGTDINTGETIMLPKNAPVIVTQRNYNFRNKKAASLCVFEGHTLRIPNKFLKFKADLCTGEEGDYSKASKEYFVNVTRKDVCRSETSRLIWVSLDKQRVNIFTGSQGNWVLDEEHVFLTSTGKPEKPTPARADAVNFKKSPYRIEGSKVQFFVEAVGSGFHAWKVKGKFAARIGKHTISHGCIRLTPEDAEWMYKNIELRTRVVIY